MALPSGVTAKLGRSIRMLSSDKDGDVLAAVAAILRLLASCGADIHALAERVESGLTEAEKQKIKGAIEDARAIGYAEGVRAAEARFRTDGKLEFSEVALYAQREIRRLPPDKHEFINKMAFYARQEFEPTQKQGRFLFDLFIQYLGGRIT